jgi:uncharacterized membrane protein
LLLLTATVRFPSIQISGVARFSVISALLLAAFAIWRNELWALKLYPVLISGTLLAVFAYSLLVPPSIIERLARRQDPNFPPTAVAYTRRVTQVWCLFFTINGAIALCTALWAPDVAWALYTGVIAYLLMGLLFGGEWLFRQRLKRLHHG